MCHFLSLLADNVSNELYSRLKDNRMGFDEPRSGPAKRVFGYSKMTVVDPLQRVSSAVPQSDVCGANVSPKFYFCLLIATYFQL